MKIKQLILLLLTLLLSSCYYSHTNKEDHWRPADAHSIDSVEFRIERHYWKGFNFLVTDSLDLQAQPPLEDAYLLSELAQRYVVSPKEPWVVVDIIPVPQHTTDSIWVKVASSQWKQGWLPERKLYEHMLADDPISRFIFFFIDSRILIFGIVLGLALIALTFALWRRAGAQNADSGKHLSKLLKRLASSAGFMAPGGWKGAFDSVYPTLLCIVTSVASALYGTIQAFAPETWVEFYFHPTINPFMPELPPIMRLFITASWSLLIIGIATVFDLLHREGFARATIHLAGLASLAILIYIGLSITIPLYVGYLLLLIYWVFAIKRYLSKRKPNYLCGACGASLDGLGECKHCGAMNVRLQSGKFANRQ